MEQRVVNNNIVILYQEDVSSLLLTDRVEAQISSIYREKEPVAVVNKFPGLQAIIVPQVQVSLILENNKLSISDQTITPFANRDTTKLMTLSRNVYDIINKGSVSYGFNFIFEIEDTFENLSSKFKTKFFKSNISRLLPENSNSSFFFPSFGFMQDGIKTTYKIDNIVEGATSSNTNRIRISVNCHINHDLEELDVLIESYELQGRNISSYITSLLT